MQLAQVERVRRRPEDNTFERFAFFLFTLQPADLIGMQFLHQKLMLGLKVTYDNTETELLGILVIRSGYFLILCFHSSERMVSARTQPSRHSLTYTLLCTNSRFPVSFKINRNILGNAHQMSVSPTKSCGLQILSSNVMIYVLTRLSY